MNSGSIDNPRTKEGQLFALFTENIGREFTTIELAVAINSGCAHTYIDGMRDQVEARGRYAVVRQQRGKLHYYKMVEARRPIPSAAQMEMAEACA